MDMNSKYPFWDRYLENYGGYCGNLHRQPVIDEAEINAFGIKFPNCFDSSKAGYETWQIFAIIGALPKAVKRKLIPLAGEKMDLDKYLHILEVIGEVVDGALRHLFTTPQEVEFVSPSLLRHHILFEGSEYNYIYTEFSNLPPEDFNTSLPIIDNLGKWRFNSVNKFHACAMFMEHHYPDISYVLYRVVTREERRILYTDYRDRRLSLLHCMYDGSLYTT